MRYISSCHGWASGCAFVLFLLCSVSAEARLTAEAALNYTNYDARDNSGRHLSGNSFTQDYSLLYDNKGTIYNSRIGRYEVALGYNWSAMDTKISGAGFGTDLQSRSSDNYRETRGHLFYSGEIQLDPKELPFRLNAYSRDLTKNSFSTSDTPLISNMFSQNGGVLVGAPNFANGIDDGIHIDSGVTLVAGVKNGMTNGYNEVLRHFPMIMLDYRDQINRDLRSTSPVDTRLSRLAFVSLNKKDNWFHYRFITFNDYINQDNNYKESQVQIGTVDQALARRWIDFSNWIQVSTDLQFTKRMNNRISENYESIDLNLFGQASRNSWELRSYNYFNRFREVNGNLTNSTNLPLYISGTLNPDVSWRTRTFYKNTHDNTGAHLTDVLAGYQVEALKSSLFTLTHFVDVESSNTNNADMLVLSTGVETTSSPKFSRQWSLAASYRFNDSVNKSTSDSTAFYVHKTSLEAGYAPNNKMRLVVRQENEFTQGTNQAFTSTVRDVNTTIPQYDNPRGYSSTFSGVSSFRSLSNVLLMWNPLPRWDYSLTASEDYFSAANFPSNSITNLTASVGYSNSTVKFNNSLNYTNSDDSVNSHSSTLTEQTTLSYVHSRSLDSKLMLSFFTSNYSGVSSTGYDTEQQLNYSYTTYDRKLLEVSEVLTYSDSPTLDAVRYYTANTRYDYNAIIAAGPKSTSGFETTGRRSSRASLSLGTKYYPLRQLMLAAGGRYFFDNTLDNYSLLWYASIGTNFRLFQASLDYYQGKRQSDGLLEKKFTANVKKLF